MRFVPLALLLALLGCDRPYTPMDFGDPGPREEAFFDRLERQASRGDRTAAFQLVWFRDWAAGDTATALRHFESDAEAGSAQAAYFLATLHMHGRRMERDLGEAERWLRLAAENGSPEARRDLAHYDAWAADSAGRAAPAAEREPAAAR